MAGNVLVTGASRRIGAAIARACADAGWAVAIHHHNSPGEAEVLAGELEALGQRACVLAGELADPATPSRLIAEARDKLGGAVRGLVNNASMFVYDRAPIADRALLDAHMHVNLAAPVALACALAAQDDLDEGSVVNLLDQKLDNLNPDFFSYTCSKLALAGATGMLAQQLGPRIRVNAISPGLTLPSLDQSEAEFRESARHSLLGRESFIEDIARAVVHLLGNRSITGAHLHVDAGQHLVRSPRDVMFATREGHDG